MMVFGVKSVGDELLIREAMKLENLSREEAIIYVNVVKKWISELTKEE